MIDNTTGKKVEVDIVVDTKKGGIPVIIGFECTAKTRPATVEWVNQMIGKHQGLPTDKVVLVSKSGYTKTALERAKNANFETIKLNETEDVNWASYFNKLQNLQLASFGFSVSSCQVKYLISTSEIAKAQVGPNTLIILEERKESGTLKDLWESTIHDRQIAINIMKKWFKIPKQDRKESFECKLTWTPTERAKIQDKSGNAFLVQQIELLIKAGVKTSPIKLNPIEFVGVSIAHGTTENIFDDDKLTDEKVQILFVKENGGKARTTISVPTSKKGRHQIHSGTTFIEIGEQDKDTA